MYYSDCGFLLYFNSQPHKEADLFFALIYASHVISTHSLTRRLTPYVLYYCYTLRYFNSQPHKEADVRGFICLMPHAYISTHSLTRRLTFIHFQTEKYLKISTHSLTRRLTNTLSLSCYPSCNFNSQPHKEADSPLFANSSQ